MDIKDKILFALYRAYLKYVFQKHHYTKPNIF